MNSYLKDNLKVDYFSGINGIRAFAVILVILYHIDSKLISGGYIGVDVFFVISGYLITRLILRDELSGRFLFMEFYGRRIRRLFPALFVTCMATFSFAALFVSPYQLTIIAKSTLGAIASVSNFIFWPEAGYFAPYAPKQPLLHTWSLGVEEQFYLIWPVILILTGKYFREHLFIVIAAIWCLSFFATLAIINGSENSAFFLMPFRIWEFATGALLLLLPRQENIFGDMFVLIGGSCVILCAIIYDKKTLFPGMAALVPCLGAAAMIIGSGARLSRLLLENTVSKYLGKISYSLYLVHWPLIIFWVLKYKKISYQSGVVLLGLTLLLGMLLHHLVEARFRYKGKGLDVFAMPTSIVSILAVSFMTLTSAHAYKTYGWTWRANKEVQSLLFKEPLADLLRHGECFMARKQTISDMPKKCYDTKPGHKNLLIAGTSRAADLYVGIEKEFRDWNVHQITGANCYTIITLETPDYCVEMNTVIFKDLVKQNKVDLVILGGMLGKHVGEDWKKTADFFEQHNVDYIVIGPRRHIRADPHRLVWEYNKQEDLDAHIQSKAKDNSDFGPLIGNTSHYFSIYDILCDHDMDCDWMVNGALIYNDRSHFSAAGSTYVAKHLKQWYEETRPK